MYWWNASKLAEDLREGRVDEKERFKYFLATFIAWNILVLVFVYSGGPLETDRLIFAAVNLALAIIGIILCYRVNRSGDNTDFIGRMICLGWPVGVWYVVVFPPVLLLIGALLSLPAAPYGTERFLSTLAEMPRNVWTWFVGGAWCGIFVILYYYFRIGRYLALVAKVKGIESARQVTTTALSDGEIVLGLFGGMGALIINIYGLMYFPGIVGLRSLSELLTYLAMGLWLLLFGSIFFWLLRRRCTKQTSPANEMNELQ